MAITQDVNTNVLELKTQVEQILLLLSQKEKFVIERRFNLDDKKRSTLEQIGQHYQVTRERVRQIETNALQKLRRNIENSPLYNVNRVAFQCLSDNGGIMREDLLLSQVLKLHSEYSVSVLQLLMSLDKRFDRVPNTVQYHPYIKLKTIPSSIINDIVDASYKLLNKNDDIMKISQVVLDLKKDIAEQHFLKKEVLLSIFQINKSFKLVEESVGLIKWRHINPKTIRDKIYFILRQHNKPMHFIEISNQITRFNFDLKRLNVQAIHNELIRYDEFILIGRGIYALKEWGYSSGTVSDIIETILKEKGSLSQDQIIDSVLKQRQVKPITVILNLKNKSIFTRVGRTQYALKNA